MVHMSLVYEGEPYIIKEAVKYLLPVGTDQFYGQCYSIYYYNDAYCSIILHANEPWCSQRKATADIGGKKSCSAENFS